MAVFRLFIILTLLLTPYLSFGVENCGKAVAYSELPLPLGIAKGPFENLVKNAFIENSKLRSLIIFGSRTHFSYGYPPNDASDLDLLFVFDSNEDKKNYRGISLELKDSFPVPLQTLLATLPAEKLFQGSEFSFPVSQAEERDLFHQAQYRPWYLGKTERSSSRTRQEFRRLALERSPFISERERKWIKEGQFNLFMPPPTAMIVNKEAIILLRDEENSDSLLHSLRERDFQNVSLINP
jgi:predicted nucleotidyltransferase